MLVITNEGTDLWNEETEKFSKLEGFQITLEHSLISLSKWESKHKIAFLVANDKTEEQIFDYFKTMIVESNVDVDALTMDRFSVEDLKTIQAYIDSSESATTFGDLPSKTGPKEVITSELIYYWMVAFNISWEAQTWHLNRLFALIRICNLKNSPPKKTPKHELAQKYADLNAQRKAATNTAG